MPAIDLDQYTGVKLHKDGKVLTATLTNPEKRNAMTPAMSKDLDRLWGDVDRDDDVNVVVLTGAGDAFCAGVDLGNVSRGESTTGKVTSRALGKEIRDRFWKMLDCETPIISKVRGPAYGLGALISFLIPRAGIPEEGAVDVLEPIEPVDVDPSLREPRTPEPRA